MKFLEKFGKSNKTLNEERNKPLESEIKSNNTKKTSASSTSLANLICYYSKQGASSEEIANSLGLYVDYVDAVVSEAKSQGVFDQLAAGFKG